jgi:3-methylcrotonyl-CoA carboxylase alpha subunit
MIKSLLIANRGEIACRVIRTARRLGVRTIAVFSEADRDAPHVHQADEAYLIGPAPAAESYLRGEVILDVARRAGAEAIHPGYGFLSENAGFSRACEAAGVIFVGPTAETIEAMGSKSRAKDLMAKAGVPLSPGYQGEDQSPQTFAREAARIGYPVLLKATAGGGGKGMRIVREKSELEGELQSAKREAVSAFGDDRFLVEKFLEGPRHLEVQVFGDGRGGVVHLFERDCSVQRRYQKVIEEAPAPRLPTEVRERLLSAGVEAARAVSYRGAGTVEFLYDGRENVYFMEMNTRLQVEHPVTEIVTGTDLVEWQLRVASGEGLPLSQDEIECRGHAVEARLYAEDPSRGYLPSTGTLTTLSLPRGRGVRIDAGVKQGGEVTPYYDPMIAKVIGHGTDRAAALSALAGALSGVRVEGVTTNAAFLHAIVTNQAFAEGGVTTRFLEAEGRDAAEARKASPTDLALAALWLSLSDGSAFRLNGPRRVRSVFEGEEPVPVSLEEEAPRRWTGMAGAEAVALDEVSVSPRGVTALEGGARLSAKLSGSGGGVVLAQKGPLLALRLHDPLARAGAGAADAASLLSPMPATVTNVLVEAGQAVEAGTPLLTIEAMKMEHVVKAPKDGKVTELPFGKGDSVKEGAALVGFEAG